MNETTRAYKLFERGWDRSVLKSVYAMGPLRTTYVPGEWAVAQSQGFFCFDTLDNAHLWMKTTGLDKCAGVELWEVEVAIPYPDARVGNYNVTSCHSRLEDIMWWLEQHGVPLEQYAPVGTVLYVRVRPVQVVGGDQ